MTAAPGALRRAGTRSATRAAYAAGAVAAVTAAGALAPALGVHRPATLCLLRAATGVPCPVCGTTTAFARLGEGDVAGALAANPVTVIGLVALVLAPLLGLARLPAPARRVSRAAAPAVLTAAAAVAWAWQLARHGLTPV